VTARTAADAVTANLIAQEQVRTHTIYLRYTLVLAYHGNNTLSCTACAQRTLCSLSVVKSHCPPNNLRLCMTT
jgi:hypothetical protein